MKLDRDNHLPLYIQLKNLMEEKIKSKEWEPGSVIPSEKELQKKFDVSRITVRQAVNQLVNDGLVTKKQGKGTYVSFPKLSHDLPNLTSFTEDIKSKGLEPKSKVLSIKRTVNKQVAEEFGVKSDTVLLNIKRLRLINGEKIGVHDCYLNTDILEDEKLKEIEELDSEDSLYELIEEDSNLRISYADEILEGGSADKEISKLLDIEEEFPLLILERITFTEEDKPIEYVKMHYRADKYQYSIRLHRNS